MSQLSKLMDVIYLLTPIVLSSFFILLGIINSNLKGIILITGAILSIILYIGLCHWFRFNCIAGSQQICKTFGVPIPPTDVNIAGSSILFILYTFTYILIPMLVNREANPYFIIMMILLVCLNITGDIKNNCIDIKQLIVASILGVVCGAIWYFIIASISNGFFLYYDELLSNNIQCMKPSEQSFKCEQVTSTNIDN